MGKSRRRIGERSDPASSVTPMSATKAPIANG